MPAPPPHVLMYFSIFSRFFMVLYKERTNNKSAYTSLPTTAGDSSTYIYFNLKFLHIMKWWCYSAGNSKETRYTVGQKSTVFSHSVILISVSAQYLEKERMEFDQNLHMHWYLHNLSWDCSIHVIISWWPRGKFDSHFREIRFSIRVDLMACLKHRSLQFRGYQNDW